MLEHSGLNAQTGVFVREGLGLGLGYMVREKSHENRDRDGVLQPQAQRHRSLKSWKRQEGLSLGSSE